MASTERGDNSPKTANPLTSSVQLLKVPVNNFFGLGPVGVQNDQPGLPRVALPQVLELVPTPRPAQLQPVVRHSKSTSVTSILEL